jgi:hypothetical protein
MENGRTTTKDACANPDKAGNSMPCSRDENCDNPMQQIAA